MFAAATTRTARRHLRTAAVAAALAVALGASASAGTASAEAASLRHCAYVAGTDVDANSNTSCAFAKNIARAFNRGVDDGDIDPQYHDTAGGRVYSPTTGRWYTMRCERLESSWGCWGGSNAYVRLIV